MPERLLGTKYRVNSWAAFEVKSAITVIPFLEKSTGMEARHTPVVVHVKRPACVCSHHRLWQRIKSLLEPTGAH